MYCFRLFYSLDLFTCKRKNRKKSEKEKQYKNKTKLLTTTEDNKTEYLN